MTRVAASVHLNNPPYSTSLCHFGSLPRNQNSIDTSIPSIHVSGFADVGFIYDSTHRAIRFHLSTDMLAVRGTQDLAKDRQSLRSLGGERRRLTKSPSPDITYSIRAMFATYRLSRDA